MTRFARLALLLAALATPAFVVGCTEEAPTTETPAAAPAGEAPGAPPAPGAAAPAAPGAPAAPAK